MTSHRHPTNDLLVYLRTLAADPGLEQVTGCYFANSKPKRSSKRSHDKAAAARLWQVSTDLVNPGPKLLG